jgi:metal-dependent hydrolase (beta-lactamase superfamily II)
MQVIALLENTRLEGRKDLVAAHGLSLHIQHGGRQILFDTGLSEAFGHNAERLGVDIRKVDLAVISHHRALYRTEGLPGTEGSFGRKVRVSANRRQCRPITTEKASRL